MKRFPLQYDEKFSLSVSVLVIIKFVDRSVRFDSFVFIDQRTVSLQLQWSSLTVGKRALEIELMATNVKMKRKYKLHFFEKKHDISEQ